MKTVIFLGDSITDAGRSRENETRTGFGYPTLVRGEIGFDYPEQYIFYNRGTCGDRVVDLYARIKNDVINMKPDILSILIGVNDAWIDIYKQNGVSADKYFKIYDMLIEEIKEALPEIKIMIMEPFTLKTAEVEDHWEELQSEVHKRAEKAKEIAEKYQLPFIALQEKFDEAAKFTPNNYWLKDGVHPSTAGHELIKREWIIAFKKIID
ncbi:MAG: SGNH/GDSL hydrolase family protein [Lachnospiraceae bacterium]|nr:SGNH/GDSL hydrolase family protein [Lachnospiraceae bacterium]